ncbi:cytochrome c oxidase subunit 3 [Marinobacterium sedimentorum]|uniref:cytochrome c oxidase subunit 3 n=1 Tax=Marinobacterium sedimentorum TaxID=2927804 RepID=UPI0020C74355|nr:cytochrome c oxidase subunit 3 [Marinobacterium sedimentorum]MCP8688474.1 cytochrome c oxidase subunit 3 [Marinobacterium sedimentorum]
MSSAAYYVPNQSRWPILASISLFLMAVGAGNLINALSADVPVGAWGWLLAVGALLLLSILFAWFRNVINESMSGLYNEQMDRSYRWGMSWFIFSEVMFFAAFFGTLFYIRNLAVPWLGGEGEKGVSHMLWEGFQAQWPLMSTPDMQTFPGPQQVIDPWHLPLINTILLVSSSFTVTLAHKALKVGERSRIVLWLAITVLLGSGFLVFQAYEYLEAYHELGLTLHAGVYGATFFILTGFHGLHVTLGSLMLIIIWLRVLRGHFDADNHFGFEAVTWYWHFVDVVWVGLFLFVYIL